MVTGKTKNNRRDVDMAWTHGTSKFDQLCEFAWPSNAPELGSVLQKLAGSQGWRFERDAGAISVRTTYAEITVRSAGIGRWQVQTTWCWNNFLCKLLLGMPMVAAFFLQELWLLFIPCLWGAIYGMRELAVIDVSNFKLQLEHELSTTYGITVHRSLRGPDPLLI